MYPKLETLTQGADPANLFETRRAFRSNLVPISILVLSIAAVVALLIAFPESGLPQSLPVIGGLSMRWISLVPAVVLLEILRRYHDDLYVFGLEKINHYEGRLSLNSSVPSLKYTDIRAVQVEQTIPGRLFNFGNVLLDSAGTDGAELTISGVLSPLELAKLIEEFREASLQRR